jgi:hypothetical protein
MQVRGWGADARVTNSTACDQELIEKLISQSFFKSRSSGSTFLFLKSRDQCMIFFHPGMNSGGSRRDVQG